MKQYPCPVVGDAGEPTHICFDKLDGNVKALCACVVVEPPFLTGTRRLLMALFDQTLRKRLAAPLSVQTAWVVGQTSSSLKTNASINLVTRLQCSA
jgi:hypothetical protein